MAIKSLKHTEITRVGLLFSLSWYLTSDLSLSLLCLMGFLNGQRWCRNSISSTMWCVGGCGFRLVTQRRPRMNRRNEGRRKRERQRRRKVNLEWATNVNRWPFFIWTRLLSWWTDQSTTDGRDRNNNTTHTLFVVSFMYGGGSAQFVRQP